ncbi:MFS general substrate transporter, partial [Cyberlindnera jadinii NRRL Y-1542]
ILLIAMLGCILVPLTLAGGLSEKWSQGYIIAPLVVGFCLVPVFVYFEAKFSRYPLAPFKLLKDRGIWSALCLAFLLNFIYYMVANYLYPVLIIAVGESVTSATRITSLYSFVSTVWSPIFAVIVAYVRRLKPFIIVGVSLWFLSTGLLYHFRGGDGAGPGIIGGLCVWGIGGTMFAYPITVSMQSATSHENLATVAALAYTMYRIGSAVGNSVSGAVWTQILPDRLARNLGNATLAAEVYADPYTFAANNAWETPQRQAVVEAYIHIQRLETVIALCFCSLLIVFSLLLRNPKLTDKVANDGELLEGQLIVKDDEDPIVEFIRTKIFRKQPRLKKSVAVSDESTGDQDFDSKKEDA